MKKTLLILVAILFLFSMMTSADYIGSKKCKMCHKGEKKGNVFEMWMERSHSKAFETLKKEGKEKDPACLECHTTAFNKGGYKIGDPNNVKFEGVGCESCHGAGSDYKKMSIMKDKAKSIAAGLIVPDEKLCVTCHDPKKSDTAKPFNKEEYFKKINHVYRK